MSFLAQIDLAALPAYPALPPRGRLLFFYDTITGASGSEASDRGSWRVIHVPPEAPVAERKAPPDLPASAVLPVTPLVFRPGATLPDEHHQNPADPESLHEAHRTLLKRLGLDFGHRLLGHPHCWQGKMEPILREQLGHRSIEPVRPDRPDGEGDFVLLLQLDADEAAGIDWLRDGTMFFWIHRDDLTARRFDRSWAIVHLR